MNETPHLDDCKHWALPLHKGWPGVWEGDAELEVLEVQTPKGTQNKTNEQTDGLRPCDPPL